MITSLQEYYNLLYLIQDENPPELAVLIPGNEEPLRIDLDTRKIDAPEYLSVATDHRAETVFFSVNRYFDNVDLSTMSCIIQFINAAGESGIYVVPFYDISRGDDNMLIPWVIEGAVTAKSGSVAYSVQFFRVSESSSKYAYNLNTLAATSKVLEGNKFDKIAAANAIEKGMGKTLEELRDDQKIDFTYVNSNLASAYEALISKMDDIEGQLNLYWTDLF
jgi:hypothetical protein